MRSSNLGKAQASICTYLFKQLSQLGTDLTP